MDKKRIGSHVIPACIDVGEWCKGYIENETFFLASWGIYFFSISAILMMIFIHRNSGSWFYENLSDQKILLGAYFFFFILLIVMCVYVFALHRDIEKIRNLKQITNYSCTSCQRAICMQVTQMNMTGIRYTFRLSEKPAEKISINAWSKKNYIFNVQPGDEVEIIQFMNYYNIIVTTKRWHSEDDWEKTILKTYIINNLNRKQKVSLLVGTWICLPIMLYLFNSGFAGHSEITETEEVLLAIFFLVHISTCVSIYMQRQK